MNEKEDRGTTPEPPKKPDSGEAWLPPRLREKLEGKSQGEEFDFLKKEKSSPLVPIITVAVVLAIAGGTFWMIRNNQMKAAAAKARAEYEAHLADSLAQVRLADSLAAAVRADSIAFAALPKREQKRTLAERARQAAAAAQGTTATSTSTPPAGTPAATPTAGTPATSAAGGAAATGGAEAGTPEAAAGEPAAPKETGPFGIDAGQFLDETRAGEVAEELKTKTGLAAAVLTLGEGDEAAFHVVLGHYSSRGSAEAKANSLLSKGLVSQAAVVALPKAP
ncbi:MAG TPA: hypothetical protein VGK89_13760 [Candidatus Eisenbacteria bacterium]